MNPEILDTNSRLYFQLYLQQLIELIAAGKTDEALDFATEELAPLAEENATCMEELEEVMALFAFPNKVGLRYCTQLCTLHAAQQHHQHQQQQQQQQQQ